MNMSVANGEGKFIQQFANFGLPEKYRLVWVYIYVFYVLMYWLLNWFDIYINKQFFDEEFDEPTVPVNVVSA